MDSSTLLFFLAGLALLIIGAEILVRGASRLALAVGISPLVIGLTVVAFGTSAPELAVSVQSAYSNQAALALGNIVGSNIFNVLFILGLCAAITPLVVAQQLVRIDVPIMISVSILLLLLSLDGHLGRLDGATLFAGSIAYVAFGIYESRKESLAVKEEYAGEYGAHAAEAKKRSHWLFNLISVAVGLVLLVLGARWLVDSAVPFARALGLSELVIGLTIIAGGTSLPEVATSVIASIRGERDIAIGNVVGSNILNILAVLGATLLVAPDGIRVPDSVLYFDLPIMIVVAVACLPIFFTGHLIARWEGFLFFAYYVAYTLYLILQATEHDALPAFSGIMLEFVIPLSLITVAIGIGRHMGPPRANPETSRIKGIE